MASNNDRPAMDMPEDPAWCRKLLAQSRVPRAIVRKDDRRIVYVNDAFADGFGYEAAKLRGAKVGEVIFFVEELTADGRWEKGHLYDAYGEVLDIQATARPVTNNGREYLDYQFLDIGAFQTIGQEFLRSCENELQRVGEELRENIGQRLTGIALLCRSLNDAAAGEDNEALSGRIREILDYVNATQKEVTGTLSSLQPVGMTGEGLVSALRYMAREIEQILHVECRVEAEEIKFSDPGVPINLYRIAQRAARSAVRYSQADTVQIRLAQTSDGLELTVEDNGMSVSEEAVEHGEYGIDIMRYRARIMKGLLEVTSDPRQGTTVRCVLPSSSLSSIQTSDAGSPA